MNLEFLFIGVVVGLVMGLTGAGGALVSIPLFVSLAGASVKEATILSLTVVILGALINLFANREKPDHKIAISLLIFASLANFFSVGLKNVLGQGQVAALLSAVALYSLWSVWTGGSNQTERQGRAGLWQLGLTGIMLGFLTTLTGLGGGVLLVPILMKVFGFYYHQAIPTSLLAMTFISASSLAFQADAFSRLMDPLKITLMSAGVLASALVLKWAVKRISIKKMALIRKALFSAVTIYSIGSLTIKTLLE